MQATDELKREHHGIELILKILKALSAKLEQDEQIPADHLNGIMAFLTVFVDECHHGKEEEFLFPALEAAGVPRDGGPIGVMLNEQEQGRVLVSRLKDALAGHKSKRTSTGADIQVIVGEHVTLLTQHIAKGKTWPNVGVGRINPDGSKGSCTSCHTRHRFSVGEARMPEACDQCHLGPGHPQIEIYEESKHGTLYHAYKSEYNFNAAGGTWTAGVDYRAPTCAACHMSSSGKVLTSHDVTERLSWETQAPLTVRPQDFHAFPAKTDWKAERNKMQAVCLQCHGNSWVEDFYAGFDKAVEEYNEIYYKPARVKLDDLYGKGLLDKTRYFDEHLELQFYELWHHEGRRARMGAMMMAPDYSWWHGFYEVKSRFNEFNEEADHLLKTGKKAYVYPNYPNATGSTQKPAAVFPKK